MITSKEVSGIIIRSFCYFPHPLWERVDASREARSYFPLPLWERVDASRQARSYFPLPLWERVASEARRVRGTTRRNLQSMLRSEPGGETSKLRDDASEAVAKGRSPRRSPWRGEFWQSLAAVSVPFDASPHPSAFGGHPLPQGEREESLFALLTPSSGIIIRSFCYFPLPLWERVASEARRVRGTARR